MGSNRNFLRVDATKPRYRGTGTLGDLMVSDTNCYPLLVA